MTHSIKQTEVKLLLTAISRFLILSYAQSCQDFSFKFITTILIDNAPACELNSMGVSCDCGFLFYSEQDIFECQSGIVYQPVR